MFSFYLSAEAFLLKAIIVPALAKMSYHVSFTLPTFSTGDLPFMPVFLLWICLPIIIIRYYSFICTWGNERYLFKALETQAHPNYKRKARVWKQFSQKEFSCAPRYTRNTCPLEVHNQPSPKVCLLPWGLSKVVKFKPLWSVGSITGTDSLLHGLLCRGVKHNQESGMGLVVTEPLHDKLFLLKRC